MLRLDVAVVGFIVFTLLGPLAGGYLGAWLVDRTGSDAIVAVLGGGISGNAIASAIGAAIGLGATLRFSAGSLLDAFVGAWPDNRPLAVDPRWQLMNLDSRFARKPSAEIQEEGPVGLGDAVGWVGAASSALLLAGMSLAAWPPVDVGPLARIGAGSGSAIDWLAAGLPAIARVVVASVLGILAGAAWSTFAGPAAQMESLEDDVEKDLDNRSIVNIPGPQ